VHAWRRGHWPGHHDQAPVTHNEWHRGKRPGRNDEVPATHKTSAAANNGLSTTIIPPCSAAHFEEELRAPHRGTSLGPFVCGARASSLCKSLMNKNAEKLWPSEVSIFASKQRTLRLGA
jgi:hypothetical protein